MSARAGLRFTRAYFKKPIGRRYQSADVTAAPTQSTIQRLWNSPIGVKTVHFWAPVMKARSGIDALSESATDLYKQWSIVLAGVSDFTRPASSLSLSQNLAITATGAIWTRWCFIIRPQNLLLAAVNFFLMCVGVTQVSRIFLYQKSIEGKTAEQIAEEDAAKVVAQSPEGAA